MKLLFGVSLFIVLSTQVALSGMHEVQTIPKVHCGSGCTLETIRFDSMEEAEAFANQYAGHYYQGDHKEWFVDIKLTEVDTNLLDKGVYQ